MATRLFLVLVMVEFTDVVFAVDSIPAIIGIVDLTAARAFMIFTSQHHGHPRPAKPVLRARDFIERFKYLHYGLALVLLFIGGKMLAEIWHLKMPTSPRW